ncbi:glycosyltransferase family 4 protein [Spelaeicoccus albus]|uniref:Glycosyltransferase involved in cell wall biosynthesis n=1 Tax=Spelaeicoccus albus TaxID=1280376 RepID=A0A7Z0A8Q7_9MICO|nr:glycosyltransferase family 4 protein [Spelaeicoccus albus]NYI66457.1 glycosyltransferase involved in cell wall biosynthesis [Spelaeicoccus albus]
MTATPGSRLTPGELARNTVITARLVGEHLHDDPMMLLFQSTRRLPRRIVRPMAAIAKRLANVTKRRGGLAFAAWAAGNDGEAQQIVAAGLESRAASRGPEHSRDTRWLGEIALQLGLADAAEQYAAMLAPESRAGRGLRSRLRWYRGDMSGALGALSGTSRSESRSRRRLASEIATMDAGWSPSLVERGAYDESKPDDAKTRILHLLTNSLPHTFSGYTMRSHAVLRAQAAAGMQPTAVTRLGYPVAIGAPLANTLDIVDDIDYYRLLPAKMAETPAARLQQQATLLAQLVDDLRPGILHTTTHFTNALVAKAVARSRGIPWVYEVRGLLEDTWAAGRADPVAALESERYRAFKAKETECMLDADLVVTLGAPMRDLLIERGVPADKTIVVPNAIDDRLLDFDDIAPAEARAALDLPRDGIWVGTVSSLVDYEGLDTLVDAVASARTSGRDVRLLIVGDGVSRSRLMQKAQDAGLGTAAVFTGRVPKSATPDYFRALDVFCVPRRDLPVCRMVSPLKPVEAMGMRRPLIVSDLPALAELIDDGRNGIAVAPDDAAAFAHAIAKLGDDPAVRRSMGESGHRQVRQQRTWSQNAAKYQRAYESLRPAIARTAR